MPSGSRCSHSTDAIRCACGDLLRNATRYVSALAIPLFLGAAAVAGPLIRTSYGIGIWRSRRSFASVCRFDSARISDAHRDLLQATERQSFMVKWLSVTAMVNLSLTHS